MIEEFFYKLRDRKTGLFRHKGIWTKWDKRGDRWSTIGHIKQHISHLPPDKIDWDNWEIVEYQYLPKEIGAKELKHWL